MKKRLMIITLLITLLLCFSGVSYAACDQCSSGKNKLKYTPANGKTHKVDAYCANCNQWLYSNYGDHKWRLLSVEEGGVYNAPTCMSGGSQSQRCSLCYQSGTAILAKDPDAHKWGEGQNTNATCTTPGVKTLVCEYNSEHTTTEPGTIDPSAHDWGEWTVTTPSTCITEGVETRICKNNAEHTETRAIKADGHKDDAPYDGYCDYDPTHDLNTAPTLTLGSFNGQFYKAGDQITLTVSATKGTDMPETWDTLAFTATLAGVQGTVMATGAEVGTESATATITWNANDIPADGSYQATVTGTDSRGVSVQSTTTSSIVIDKSNPEKPTIDANTEWTNDDVEVIITAGNADVAGLDKVTYVLSGATTKAETEITSGGKITIKNEGETTITAYTYDKAGNKSEASNELVRIEKILPTVTYTPNGSNGEYAQEFTTVVTVEDLGAYISGVDASSLKYMWTTSTTKPTEAEFANNGTAFASGDEITTPEDVSDNHYLWVLAKDNAGNVAIVRSEKFLVDNVNPTVEFDKNENTTYEQGHKVEVTVKDASGVINSGVDASSLKYLWTTSDVAPTEADFANGTAFASGDEIATPEGETGEYYLWVIAKDNVGNTEITGSGVQRIDNEAPTLEYTLLVPNSYIYSAFEVIVSDMFDGEERSGVNDSELKYQVSLKPVAEGDRTYPESYTNNTENRFPENLEGQYYLYIVAEDKAGNVIEKTEIVVIDTKMPVITYNPDGNTTFANSHSTVVTISDYSMITSAKYVWTTSGTEEPADNKFEENFVSGDRITTPEGATGDYYLWVMVEDKAGNVIKTTSEVFKLDNTLPQVEFNPDGDMDYANSHETKVTVTEGADESGVNLDSLKYVWTTSPETPSKEEITESFTNGEKISTPEGEEGVYYLWVYAEDNVGNPIIIGSNLFNVDDKNVVVNFDPYENKAYASEHSTKVTFSDLGSKVKEDSLKYFWTTDATIENPEESLFTNSFVNGSLIETPEDGQGIYYLWVIGEDNVGNTITARSGEFWVDNTELPIDLTIIENVGITGRGIHVEVDGTQKPFKEDSIKWLITYSSEKPLVSDFENPAENNSDVLFEEGIEQQAYVWVMAEDENGVVHMEYIYMIIDTKAPTVEFNPNGNAEDMSVVETEVTVTDYSIVEGSKYLWTDDATLEPTADQFTEEFESGDIIAAPLEDGDYYLWVLAEDLVGNTEIVRSEVFKVDHTAPTNPVIKGNEVIDGVPSEEELPTGSATNKDVLVEVIPGVDERDEGVETTVTITKDGNPVEITPDADGKYPLTEEGKYEVTVITKDKAGNESEEVVYEVTIDKRAPMPPSIKGKETTGELKDIPDGWITKEDVEVTITCEEGAEVIVTIYKDGNPVEITPNADGKYPLTEEGEYKIVAVAKDKAGNESGEGNYLVIIDRTAPTAPVITGVELTGNMNEIPHEGKTKEEVKVTIKVTEDLSEVDTDLQKDGDLLLSEDIKYIRIEMINSEVSAKPGCTVNLMALEEVTIENSGTYVFKAKAVDVAGNESEEVTYQVTINKVDAPRFDPVEDNTDEIVPDKGITNEDVIIYTHPNDNDDDMIITIKKDGEDVTDSLDKNGDGYHVLKEEGEYEITIKSVDEDGNESEEVTQTLTIDKTAPVPSIIGKSEPTKEELPDGSLTNKNVVIEINPGEDNREDATVTPEVVITKDGEDVTDTLNKDENGNYILEDDGRYEVTVKSQDELGNESEEIIYIVRIDKEPPAPTPIKGKETAGEEKFIPHEGITCEDVMISIPHEEELIVEFYKDGEKIEDPVDENGNYVLTEEGTYVVKAKGLDPAGNESEETIYEVTIDKTAPTPSIIGKGETTKAELPNGTMTNDNVVVEVDLGEDEDVTPEVTITKDGTDVTDTLEKDADGNYVLEDEGKYEVTVTAKDEVGNESGPVTYEVTIDKTAPNAPIIIVVEMIKDPGKPAIPGVVVPNRGSTKEEVKVEPDEDEEGETTTIVIKDQDGNDRTDDFTDEETGDITIDESGEYEIIATTTPNNNPDKKVETITNVKVDLDAPVAENDEKATEQNTPVDGKVEATDNFEVTEYEVKVEPEHGTVTIDPTTGEYTYTPEDGYYGEDEFKVVAKDEVGNESEEAIIKVNVRKELEESDVVEEKDKSISTYKNKEYTSKELPENDKNGDALRYTISENPTNGTVTFDETTRKFVYTPNEDYLGTDTFKMEVTNGKETVVITFNVEVKKKSSSGSGNNTSDKVEEEEETVTHEWYIRGYEDGTVRPNGNITREEMAMIFYRLMVGSNNTVKSRKVVSYSDIENNRWSYDAIMYLTEKGILEGYEDGTFKPTAQIKRAEFALILERYAKLTSKTSVEFTDVAKDHWAKDAIEKVVTKGWMIGYEDGTFKPNAKLTRAEAAVAINRLLGRNAEKAKVENNPFSDLKASHWAYKEMLEAITTHTCVLVENSEGEWKSYEYPYLGK